MTTYAAINNFGEGNNPRPATDDRPRVLVLEPEYLSYYSRLADEFAAWMREMHPNGIPADKGAFK